jgi:AAA15 family ATPase/GTPase
MLAPKTKVKNRFPNNYTTLDVGIDVLKTAVVVGENAGGKSNFVRSLSYLQSFFVKTEPVKAYRGVINTNSDQDFCPKKNKASQSFEIEIFMEENILYLYRLEIDFVGIAKEAFYYKDRVKSRYKKIFSMERDNCTIECREEEVCKNSHNCHARVKVAQLLSGPESESKIGESLEKSSNKEKMLGLTIIKYALLGNEHAIAFTDWIKNDLCPKTNIINYDIYKSMKNEEEDLQILCDARYLDIFRMIDYSIIDFKVDEEKPFSKTMIVRQKRDGSTFARELAKDSSGVREFFAWAVQIFKVVYENKTVFADEMDRVLNPVLADRVISFICGKKHLGQFIFTTHNVLHLDLKNYMKEQIYFITKDIETLESELYSLADFPEIRYETTKIYEFYMKGILGGTAIE